MEMPLRPERGGFLRPFGCGQFIREFLLGHGPEESPPVRKRQPLYRIAILQRHPGDSTA